MATSNYTTTRDTMRSIIPPVHFELMDRIMQRMALADTMFYTMPFLIGVLQLVLNVFVIVSVGLLWKMGRPGMGGAAAISR